MSKRGVVVLLAVLALAGCGGGASKGAGPAATATPAAKLPPATGDLSLCAGLVQDAGRTCYTREIRVVVDAAGSRPLPAVQRVAEAAYAERSGFLLANCHGIMHTVGRTYAEESGLELGTLMSVLPQSNDPGCSAGFAMCLQFQVSRYVGLLGE